MKTDAPPIHRQIFLRCDELVGGMCVIGPWQEADLRGLIDGNKTMIVVRRGSMAFVKFVPVSETRFWFDAYGS